MIAARYMAAAQSVESIELFLPDLLQSPRELRDEALAREHSGWLLVGQILRGYGPTSIPNGEPWSSRRNTLAVGVTKHRVAHSPDPVVLVSPW
jgi:hypothetical protein